MRPSILLAKSIFSFREIEPKETRNLPTFDVGVGQRASLQGLSCGFARVHLVGSAHRGTLCLDLGPGSVEVLACRTFHPVVHVCVFLLL